MITTVRFPDGTTVALAGLPPRIGESVEHDGAQWFVRAREIDFRAGTAAVTVSSIGLPVTFAHACGCSVTFGLDLAPSVRACVLAKEHMINVLGASFLGVPWHDAEASAHYHEHVAAGFGTAKETP